MLITVTQTTRSPDIQYLGTSPTLRLFYSKDFLAGDGVTPVGSGNGLTGFYDTVTCSINGSGQLVIPSFTIQSTTDGDLPTSRLTGQLFDQSGAPQEIIFGNQNTGNGWQIPTLYGATVAWDDLYRYNRTAVLLNPSPTYATYPQMIAEIARRAGQFLYAAVGILGLVRMRDAPDVASEPTAIGANSYAAVGVNGIAQPDVAPISALLPKFIGLNSRRVTEMYNVKATAIGAIGDGTTNDRAALNTLVNTTLQLSGVGGEVYFPAGDYLISSNMTFPANVRLNFDPRARLKPANGVTITDLTDHSLWDKAQKFTNALSGQGTVTVANYRVLPHWWGAVHDGVTDDHASLQAAFDANASGFVDFCGDSFASNGSVTLTNASGRNWNGHILGNEGTVTFTNAGNSADSDIAMQRGFESYPTTNGVGGDSTGLVGVIVDGLNVVGPTNGCGFYSANSSRFVYQNAGERSKGIRNNRYGIVLETAIQPRIANVYFENNKNAGLGTLFLNDITRVYYGATPASSYWNDSPIADRCMFVSTGGGGRLAGWLDMGSNSERVRTMTNCAFVTDIGAIGTGMVYGYLGRKANPTITNSNWFENVPYPIRLLTTNASLGVEVNLTGISGAQPSGTYSRANMPDGNSESAIVMGNHFVKAQNNMNLQGVSSGTGLIGQNTSSGLVGFHLVLTETPGLIISLGDSDITNPGVPLPVSVSYPETYKDLSRFYPFTAASGKVGIGTTSPLTTMHIEGGGTDYSTERGSLLITGGTALKRLAFGIDTSGTMYSWIQSVETGSAPRELKLNPEGGAISMGGPVTGSGALTSSGTGGVGYSAGAGGVVTQATNKSTAVVLNKTTGAITMHNAALNAGISVSFTLTNSTIAATDTVIVNLKSGNTANSYNVSVDAVAAGSCVISLRNYTAGNLSEAVVISFVVVKGVTT